MYTYKTNNFKSVTSRRRENQVVSIKTQHVPTYLGKYTAHYFIIFTKFLCGRPTVFWIVYISEIMERKRQLYN